MAVIYHEGTIKDLEKLLSDASKPPMERLHLALRMVARHRSALIANTLVHHGGTEVRSGPFAGMVLTDQPAEGCFAPKLLGTYEQELHAVVELMKTRRYSDIVSIGSAEGYYSVGLARLLPDAVIWAHDIDAAAQETCRQMAEKNGVSERVRVGGVFTHGDFARFADRDACVFCDIEGAEIDLLDPEKAPALRGLDIVVELHNTFEAPFNASFIRRFEATHDIRRLSPGMRDISVFPELRNFEHLDQLLAFWEFRRGPNPWLHMTAKQP